MPVEEGQRRIPEMSKDERSWKCLSPKPIPEITLKHMQI
jgi:hypothetical protein